CARRGTRRSSNRSECDPGHQAVRSTAVQSPARSPGPGPAADSVRGRPSQEEEMEKESSGSLRPEYSLSVPTAHRIVLCWWLGFAGCFQPVHQVPCMVSCAADGVCPTGLTCGADQLCHGGATECSVQLIGTFGHQLITNDTNGNTVVTDLQYGADQVEVS